jgi:predicted Rossmann fold flavoprotein
MKGVKNDSLISIYVDNKFIKSEYGELLFTDYGLSGPPVFQLSRIASKACSEKKNVFVTVDLMPDVEYQELVDVLKLRNKFVPVAEFLTGMTNKLVGRQILKSCGIEKFNSDSQIISDDIIKKIANCIKCWKFNITGTNSWDMSKVTAGGIVTDDFDPKTMKSEFAEGLYAAGEILDIDGDCGGFNLQWAWSSGYIAGISCAKSLE